MVGARLAVVSNNLEAANHFSDGEETEALGSDDTAGHKLRVADVAGLLQNVLRSLEQGAVLERLPQVLIDVLKGGDGTASTELAKKEGEMEREEVGFSRA